MARPTYANTSDLHSANFSPNHDEYHVESYSIHTATAIDVEDGPPSSPFVTNVPDSSNHENEENVSPSKQLSRLTAKSLIDSEPSSPVKTLKSHAPTTKAQSPQKHLTPMKSPRKLSSPEKRLPIKVSLSPEKQLAVEGRTVTIGDVLRDNEGLTKAFEILEDEDSALNNDEPVADDTITSLGGDNAINMDETMVSTFSMFSAGTYCLDTSSPPGNLCRLEALADPPFQCQTWRPSRGLGIVLQSTAWAQLLQRTRSPLPLRLEDSCKIAPLLQRRDFIDVVAVEMTETPQISFSTSQNRSVDFQVTPISLPPD